MQSTKSTLKIFQKDLPSKDLKSPFQFYVLCKKCLRDYQEDRMLAIQHTDKYSIFAIFDGHGGAEMSQYSRDYFHEIFQNQPDIKAEFEKYGLDITKSSHVEKYFQNHVDVLQKKSCENKYKNAGTTMNLSLIYDKYLYCINIGDSRTIGLYVKQLQTQQLTRDHKPYGVNEKNMVSRAGGFVKQDRVDGVLAMSRSIGDSTVNANRQIEVFKYKVKDFFLLALGSDGIFDTLDQQEIFDRTLEYLLKDPNKNPLETIYKQNQTSFSDNASLFVIIIQSKDRQDLKKKTQKDKEIVLKK